MGATPIVPANAVTKALVFLGLWVRRVNREMSVRAVPVRPRVSVAYPIFSRGAPKPATVSVGSARGLCAEGHILTRLARAIPTVFPCAAALMVCARLGSSGSGAQTQPIAWEASAAKHILVHQRGHLLPACQTSIVSVGPVERTACALEAAQAGPA